MMPNQFDIVIARVGAVDILISRPYKRPKLRCQLGPIESVVNYKFVPTS